jgi:hypothetical protein
MRETVPAAVGALDKERTGASTLDTFRAQDGLRVLSLSLRGEKNKEWLTPRPLFGGRARSCLTDHPCGGLCHG